MRQVFAKTGGPNAAANGSSTIRRVWKPRFCMCATVRTNRENTNPKRQGGIQQFECGKEDGPSLTRRVGIGAAHAVAIGRGVLKIPAESLEGAHWCVG